MFVHFGGTDKHVSQGHSLFLSFWMCWAPTTPRKHVFVGSPENLKKLVKELNLNEQVIFLKNISNNMKNALLAKSNIFVMPSIIYKRSVEGFGIAFIEAAQYGLPSLGGLDGGAPDAIINNKTGILCNGNNLNEIHESIEKMLIGKKYIELGKNAKKNSENFLWEKIILKYKKILITS